MSQNLQQLCGMFADSTRLEGRSDHIYSIQLDLNSKSK